MSTYSRFASLSPKRTYRGTTRQLSRPCPSGRSDVESRTIAVDSADSRATPRRLTYRPDDLLQPTVLGQTCHGPCFAERLDLLLLGRGGQDDHRALGTCGSQRLRRLDSVEARQPVVEEHDRRLHPRTYL